MAQYTVDLSEIVESLTDQTDQFYTVDQLIEKGRSRIFDDYPIFDEKYRPVLENHILKYFWTREIGTETPQLFKFYLNEFMKREMPYFNLYYESALKNFDWNTLMQDTNYTDTVKENKHGRVDSRLTSKDNLIGNENNSQTTNSRESLLNRLHEVSLSNKNQSETTTGNSGIQEDNMKNLLENQLEHGSTDNSGLETTLKSVLNNSLEQAQINKKTNTKTNRVDDLTKEQHDTDHFEDVYTHTITETTHTTQNITEHMTDVLDHTIEENTDVQEDSKTDTEEDMTDDTTEHNITTKTQTGLDKQDLTTDYQNVTDHQLNEIDTDNATDSMPIERIMQGRNYASNTAYTRVTEDKDNTKNGKVNVSGSKSDISMNWNTTEDKDKKETKHDSIIKTYTMTRSTVHKLTENTKETRDTTNDLTRDVERKLQEDSKDTQDRSHDMKFSSHDNTDTEQDHTEDNSNDNKKSSLDNVNQNLNNEKHTKNDSAKTNKHNEFSKVYTHKDSAQLNNLTSSDRSIKNNSESKRNDTDENTSGFRNTNQSSNSNNLGNQSSDNLRDYVFTRIGKKNVGDYPDLLMKWRKTFINVDNMVINKLQASGVFMELW